MRTYLCALAAFLPLASLAADLSLTELEKAVEIGQVDIDLSVPESPAFVALGINPEDVTRPATPREFATSLLSAVDKEGNFQAGFALDTAPYVLARGVDFDLAEYRENPERFSLTRFLARTQVSVAVAKGTSNDDEATRLGLGFRFTPWSEGDPRLDTELLQCLLGVAAIPEAEDTPSPSESVPIAGASAIPLAEEGDSIEDWEGRLDAAEAQMEAKTAGCIDASESRNAHASGWDLGMAPTWIQEGGSNSSLSWGGATFWTSLALGGRAGSEGEPPRSEFILHGRYRLDESVADDAASSGYREQDSLLIGGRARFGRPDLAFSLEGAYVRENARGSKADSSIRGSVGAEARLTEKLWVQVALGASGGREEDRIFIGGTVKWGGKSFDVSELVGALGKLSKPAE
jgi:hypothetical protein